MNYYKCLVVQAEEMDGYVIVAWQARMNVPPLKLHRSETLVTARSIYDFRP